MIFISFDILIVEVEIVTEAEAKGVVQTYSE